MRQSRRLAALAEAHSPVLPQNLLPGVSTASGAASMEAAGQPGGSPRPRMVRQQQSPVLLQASTLEASAKVLKGLVSTAIT